jgi:hypothetical protein
MPIALVLFVLAQHSITKSFSGTWQGGWVYIAAFAVFYVSIAMWKQGMKAFIPLFAWVCLSGTAVGFTGMGYPMEGTTTWPTGEYTNASISTSVRFFSLQALAIFIAMSAIGVSISKQHARHLTNALSAASFFVALSIMFDKVVLHKEVKLQVTIIDNPSMCASMAVLGILYVAASLLTDKHLKITSKRRALYVSVCTALLVTTLVLVSRHTPITMAGAGLWVIVAKYRPRIAGVLLLFAAAALIYVFPTQAAIESGSSGRIEFWRILYTYWSGSWDRIIFGTGVGTTTLLQPLLSGAGNFFSHSSWGQIPFELGCMGSAAALMAFGRVIYGLRKSLPMLVLAAAYAACMVSNFPNSSSIHALFLLVILRRSV